MNEPLPLVSIVIPLYNAENYIEETLQSIVNQTYKNFEVIVVDNASTDSSLNVVKQFSTDIDSLIVIESNKNSGGPACPRNIGIECAKGEYIAFLDSDDVWENCKLEVQIELMEQGGFNFTCTNRVFIDKSSRLFSRKMDSIFKSRTGNYGLKELIVRNDITTSSVMISRDFLGSNKFSELSNFICVEDYLLWLSLMSRDECEFYHIKENLVRYRLFKDSLSKSDGGRLLLAKSMLASCFFMVENNKLNYFFRSLASHLVRFLLIRFKQ
ncbi:glycosyltransferase family 2 protein [Vibrio tubiashii]|uniref:glycosyltransferase family 2 protein n=1 Tax=Vibrio tubiashii TaxID=29498 RepID=UPI00349E8E22